MEPPASSSPPGPRRAGAAAPAVRPGGYEVLGELGRGGMGVVYRARDPSTGREVALKTPLRPQPDALARFRREAEALAALDHPGIVRVHATGEADGRPFMVCELVEGARPLDVATLRLPVDRRAALVRDASRALGHAHARGVVHRDVKVENLLVDAAGRVRVADFGASLLDGGERLTRTGAVVGTPFNMAPEQLAGDRGAIAPTTDVWALGVVLYQVLTGSLPFAGDTLPELCARIVAARPVPPRRLVPTVSASLEAVCLRALSRAPVDRWPDGDAMADALDTALRGERVAGPRRSLRQFLWLVAPVASLGVLAAALTYHPDANAPRPSIAAPPAPPAPGPAPVASPVVVAPPVDPSPPAAPQEPEPALVALLRGQADDGMTGAMMQLARMHEQGTGGVVRDEALAREWFRRAAQAGDASGMVEYGKMLLDGRGGPSNLLDAVKMIRTAAEQGHAEGAAEYGRVHRRGLIGFQRKRNMDQAVHWFRQAVLRESDSRTRGGYRAELADTLIERGDLVDQPKALEQYTAAVADGSVVARVRLAEHLLLATFGERDPARARDLLESVRRDEPERSPAKVEELLRRCEELAPGR